MLLFALVFIFVITGCSSIVESTRKNLGGSTAPRTTKKEVKYVGKAQYDDLMAKYKNLSERYENLKEESVGRKLSKDFDQISELSGDPEAIDVFGKNGIVNNKPKINKAVSPDKIGKDIEYYKKAMALHANQKEDEALKIFQFLENSQAKQIQVRSKRYIGDIYFGKKKYDIALQVYEGIIREHAFSGTVIKALEFAGKCSGKLGLKEKQLKYESILRDFFEVRV